jgi:hypothetical protein
MRLPAMLACSTALLLGCESPAPPATTPVSNRAPWPAPPAPSAEWRCFVADPRTPELPQGNVTHAKHRWIEGRFETANVHRQAGRAGATRIVYQPVGDRFEATLGDGQLVLTRLALDGSHWHLHFRDPASGWEFSDESKVDADGMTITSTDPQPDGAPPKRTELRFVPAPCADVDAALAQHPE